MKLKLVVGDWSNDGHNQSEDFVIESNLSEKEIDKAYKSGTKTLGFDLVKNICCEYEDSHLEIDKVKIIQSKITDWDSVDSVIDEEGLPMSPVEYVNLYLHIIKLGDPKFLYTIISDNIPSIKIGGYGLFQ